MRLKIVVSCGCVISAWLAFLGAARGQVDDDIEMELFFAPAETVTSASRHEQPLEHSPSPITVITREEIEASGGRTLPEVLRLVPNMDVAQVKPMWYAVGVRGGTTEASDSLLLLVDGRDVTFELLGSPLWTTQHFSMDEVERIEIIRGPGSALYGANAFAGVVQVFTRKPGRGDFADVSVRGGERGALELEGTSSFNLGPCALLLSTGWLHRDLWTAHDSKAHDVVRGRLRGEMELWSGSLLTVETGALMASGRLHLDAGSATLRDSADLFSRVRIAYRNLLVQASYERAYINMDLGLNLYYPALQLNLAEVPPIDAVTDKVATLAQYSFELPFNRLTTGVEYVFNAYHAEIFVQPDHREHRVGTFVQDEFDLSGLINELAGSEVPSLYLVAGLRYDYNSKTRFELSPRAAVVFAPNNQHSVRFGYAHAFLKPTFFESSLDIKLQPRDVDINELDIASPELDNQTIDSIDLGWQGYFFGRLLEVHLDLAYNWYRHSIGFSYDPKQVGYLEIGGVRIPDINSGGFGFSNNPHGVNGHDVDLQVVARPVDNLRLFVTAGYRQLFWTNNREFSHAEPAIRLASGLDFRTTNGLSFALRAFYTSQHWRTMGRPTSILEPMVEIEVPAYLLLNARLEWRLPVGSARLRAGLEGFNLLGARFRELPGFTRFNQPDFGGERLGRRVVLFLRGTL